MSSRYSKHPLDALSTELTASRSSWYRNNVGGKHEREQVQNRVHVRGDIDYLVHQNQKKARRKYSNTEMEPKNYVHSQKEKEERYRQEQQEFHYCEVNFLHLIRRWEEMIRDRNSNQLTRFCREILDNVESFTAPFSEEYGIKTLINESHRFLDNDLIKQVRDKFSKTYMRMKRRVPIGFKAKKNTNIVLNGKKEMNERSKERKKRNEYVDIFVMNGKIVEKNKQELQIILLRATKLGQPPYGKRFLDAKNSREQLKIASYVWGAIKNTELRPVRFVFDEWIEVGYQETIHRLIAVALSSAGLQAAQNIQPTNNDIIIGQSRLPSKKSDSGERVKIRQVLDRVLQLGNPSNRERFQDGTKRGGRKQLLGITEQILRDIQRTTSPPIRFVRQFSNSDNWKEETSEQVIIVVLYNEIHLMLTETQPMENDVLQFGVYSEDDTRFDHREGNKMIGRVLQTEGYFDKYRKACLEHPKNRIQLILEIQKQVFERMQELDPPMRLLFQVPGKEAFVELVGQQRMLSINRILWNGYKFRNDGRSKEKSIDGSIVSLDEGDLVLAGYKNKSFSVDDTEQLRHIISQTGKLDCFLQQFRQASTPYKKRLVAAEFLFVIRILNPSLRILNKSIKENGKYTRTKVNVLISELVKILNDTNVNDKITSQNVRVTSIVREHSLSDGELVEDNHDEDEYEYFILDETIFIDIEEEEIVAKQHGAISRESILYGRILSANETMMMIKKEPEEEQRTTSTSIEGTKEAEEDNTTKQLGSGPARESISDVLLPSTNEVHLREENNRGKNIRVNDGEVSIPKANEEMSIKQEQEEEEHIMSSESNSSTEVVAETIKREPKQEPKQEPREPKQEPKQEPREPKQEPKQEPREPKQEPKQETRHETIEEHTNRNPNIRLNEKRREDIDEGMGDDKPQIEIIEIDLSGDESTVEAATTLKMEEEDVTDNDHPLQIKTIDVNMSDAPIVGDLEYTETSTITGRKATAIRILRGRTLEVTLPPSGLQQCMNGNDILKSVATQAVLDKSHLFIFSESIRKAICDGKKVVRYEFRGQNPTSAQFKLLPIDDILSGDENTVLIKMSINDVPVEEEGDVTSCIAARYL